MVRTLDGVLAKKLREWRDDPVSFTREVFGVEPSPHQRQYLEAVASSNSVAVRSGHGVGKSASNSWLVAWFLLTRVNSKVITTAPTKRQLFDILWAELRMWLRKARIKELTELLDVKVERITVGGRPEWFARAIAINVQATPEEQAETLAGYHAEHLLCIIDEASGVPDPVFKPIDGFMTQEDNKVCMTSNPTRDRGYFYEVFNNEAFSRDWTLLHFNSEDSLLVSPSYCEKMERKYGRFSNEYRVRVLGEFPLFTEERLIAYNDIRNATLPEAELRLRFASSNHPVIWGVDPAQGGADESVICIRRGSVVLSFERTSGLKPHAVAEWIIDKYEEAAVKPDQIIVEVNGGSGVEDILSAYLGGELIVPLDVCWSAYNPDKFFQLRDELWWRVREAFEYGFLSVPRDEELIRQLSSFKYKTLSSGKKKVSSKEELRKELRRSPDLADALMISLYLEEDFDPRPNSIGRLHRAKRSWRAY